VKHMLWLACVMGTFLLSAQAQTLTVRQPDATPTSVTVPAGTTVLMRLTSPLHTTSAADGSGVYLETIQPVVQDNGIVIPPHSHVLGTVEHDRRPGRIKGRAQFRIVFKTMILPDNRVFSIAGNLQSLPGSRRNRAQDAEHTIEPVDQIDRDVYTVVKGSSAGFLGAVLAHGGPGILRGAAIGGGLGLAKDLFTRGDEIELPVGTTVEMVLARPLTVEGQTPVPINQPDKLQSQQPVLKFHLAPGASAWLP